MKNLVDEIMIAAQEFADARVMAVRGRATSDEVLASFDALREAVESVQVEIDRITECGRAHIRRSAEFEAQRDDARQRAENIRTTMAAELEYEIRRTRSLDAAVFDLMALVNALECERDSFRDENERLARQLREVRPLVSYGGTY